MLVLCSNSQYLCRMSKQDSKSTWKAVGARISELRIAMGWSQTVLAQRLRVAGFPVKAQGTISQLELGDRQINIFEAYALAEVFGITIDQLAGREPISYGPSRDWGLREAIQILSDELGRTAA